MEPIYVKLRSSLGLGDGLWRILQKQENVYLLKSVQGRKKTTAYLANTYQDADTKKADLLDRQRQLTAGRSSRVR
jgi:hypothetical protein